MNIATPKAEDGIWETLANLRLKRSLVLVSVRFYMTCAWGPLVRTFSIRVSVARPRPTVPLLIRLKDSESKTIKELYIDPKGNWQRGSLCIEDAVIGTNIAAVSYVGDIDENIRVYYQSPLGNYLKEYCFNRRGWSSGEYNSPVCLIRATYFLQRRIPSSSNERQVPDKCSRIWKCSDSSLLG